MNKKLSTESENSIPFKEVKPTEIRAASKPADVTYKDIAKLLEQYIDSETRGYEGVSHARKGKAKSLPNKLKIQTLIQGLNEIIMDHIISENKDMNLHNSLIVSDFFSGFSQMSSILDNIDIKVADDKLLCYIIGYMIKLLNNHERYQNKL